MQAQALKTSAAVYKICASHAVTEALRRRSSVMPVFTPKKHIFIPVIASLY
jgi:hypothetical protein